MIIAVGSALLFNQHYFSGCQRGSFTVVNSSLFAVALLNHPFIAYAVAIPKPPVRACWRTVALVRPGLCACKDF